jgi:rhodanese-related sulfurtransferase
MKYAFAFLLVPLLHACGQHATESHAVKAGAGFVCLPCGRDCDKDVYTKAGNCASCNMELVEQSTVVFKNVAPADLYPMITAAQQKILLLDVRSAAEFDGTAEEKFGKLKGAVNIPVDQLEHRLHELDAYKHLPIVVYCSHAHRSAVASYLLTQKGFTDVSNLLYGMHQWRQRVTDKVANDQLYIGQ